MDIEYEQVNADPLHGSPGDPSTSNLVKKVAMIEQTIENVIVFLGVKTSPVVFFVLGIVCLLIGFWQFSIAWKRQMRLNEHQTVIRNNMQHVVSKKRSVVSRRRANSTVGR